LISVLPILREREKAELGVLGYFNNQPIKSKLIIQAIQKCFGKRKCFGRKDLNKIYFLNFIINKNKITNYNCFFTIYNE